MASEVAFIKKTNAVLTGATVTAAGKASAIHPTNVPALVAAGAATRLDGCPAADLATAGFAKNGVHCKDLTGTTPVNVDLTDLTSGATSYDGDTAFALRNLLIVNNTGAADITVKPGSSNGLMLGFSSTALTVTVPAGSRIPFHSAAGETVDSTHKVITITPTSGGSVAICVGGA